MKSAAVILLVCILGTATSIPTRARVSRIFGNLNRFYSNRIPKPSTTSTGSGVSFSTSGKFSLGSGSSGNGFNVTVVKWNKTADGTTVQTWNNKEGSDSVSEGIKFEITDDTIDELEETKYEEPEYTLAEQQPKSGKYEVRVYSQARWVCTNVKAGQVATASSIGFTRLFNYISGNNNQGKKIDMTVPVATFQRAARCPFCMKIYTVCFYLPKDAQTNTPAPNSPLVTIQSLGPMKIFARKFAKVGFGDLWKQQARQLAQDINVEGQHTRQYRTDYFISSSYTNPLSFNQPRSEVWLVSL